MRLVLIPTIPNGYAQREFEGIKYCLDQTDSTFCEIYYMDNRFGYIPRQEDFYLIADYYYNPTFNEKEVPENIHEFIHSLPSNRVALYYSDLGFKFEDPSKFSNWSYFVAFSLANYMDTKTEDYANCRVFENVDISKKQILNIPIPELAFWSYLKQDENLKYFNMLESPKQQEIFNDISYIINSRIKTRKSLLTYLDGIKSQMGNLPIIDDEDIKKFVIDNPNNDWVTQKVFGIDYLFLQNGYATLVLEDDLPVKVFFPMRIYEAAAVGIIPIMHAKNHCRLIYDFCEYPNLPSCVFSTKDGLENVIREIKEPKFRKLVLKDLKDFMQKNVYDYKSLFNKTFKELEKFI